MYEEVVSLPNVLETLSIVGNNFVENIIKLKKIFRCLCDFVLGSFSRTEL